MAKVADAIAVFLAAGTAGVAAFLADDFADLVAGAGDFVLVVDFLILGI
ncbi:MAG: hypothetical protein WD941_07775 [Opitutus sp.]